MFHCSMVHDAHMPNVHNLYYGQPYAQQAARHCVFWYFSITANTNFCADGIPPDPLTFAPHTQHWALNAHDPVAGSEVVLP